MESYESITSDTVLLYPCAQCPSTRVSPVDREVCSSIHSGLPRPRELPESLLFPLEILAVHRRSLDHVEDSLPDTKVSVCDRTQCRVGDRVGLGPRCTVSHLSGLQQHSKTY